MLRPIDNYYNKQEEPIKSCLQYLRTYILGLDNNIAEAWKYGMPFFCYNGKMFCYLWVHKKHAQPYIGIVEGTKIDHPDLLQEKRARMKILLLDASNDLPMHTIEGIMQNVLKLYTQS